MKKQSNQLEQTNPQIDLLVNLKSEKNTNSKKLSSDIFDEIISDVFGEGFVDSFFADTSKIRFKFTGTRPKPLKYSPIINYHNTRLKCGKNINDNKKFIKHYKPRQNAGRKWNHNQTRIKKDKQ